MGYYRLRKTSEGQFASVSDDGNMGYIGSDIYAFNGTNNVTVFNTMYRSSDGGRNWTQLADADWSIRNASGAASVGSKIYLWGGNDMTNTLIDSWEFDGTTYTQISASMSGFGAGRKSFAFGYSNGFFYAIGGNNQNTIIKSDDLITWTTVSILPASLQNMGGMTACVWNGVWYIVSGQSNDTSAHPGEVWKSTDDLVTLELVITDTMFANKWNNIEATNDALFLVKGHNGVANQQGCYYCENAPETLANWKLMSYGIPATHANPLLSFNGKIYSYSGNMRNDSWEFARVDV